MYCMLILVCVAGFASTLSAIPTKSALLARHGRKHSSLPKAIYILSNKAQNEVVAIRVKADGTLAPGSITPTGGVGGSGIDGMTNDTAGPDPLFSQSALKVDGNVLAAVNPMSSTLSLFTISPNDPTQLNPCGAPASTLGDFPNTVALSAKLGMACVGNTGTAAGISCFAVTTQGPVPFSDSPAATFDIGQSNPPVGPTNTVSHSFFDESTSSLVTTVKGDPMKNITGFVSVLPIENGAPAAKDVRSTPEGTVVLFGSVVLPGSSSGTSSILATDAGFGTATLSLDASTKQVSAVNTVKIEDQKATCWAAFSKATKSTLVTDVAVSHLVEVDPTAGKILQSTDLGIANVGLIDLVIKGKFVYALSPGNQTDSGARVVVMKTSGRGQKVSVVQEFEVDGVGKTAQGIAMM